MKPQKTVLSRVSPPTMPLLAFPHVPGYLCDSSTASVRIVAGAKDNVAARFETLLDIEPLGRVLHAQYPLC